MKIKLPNILLTSSLVITFFIIIIFSVLLFEKDKQKESVNSSLFSVSSSTNSSASSKEDMVSVVLAKNGCTWDNLKITDSAAFTDCMMQVVDKLEKEQNTKVKEYTDLLSSFPNDKLHIPNQPYSIETAIQKITDWNNKTHDYIESRCNAESSTIDTVSGSDEIKTGCEISLLQDNIDFLNDRIKTFQDHFDNIENLIKSGVINKDTSY
mgnify:CR=1 FL=1